MLQAKAVLGSGTGTGEHLQRHCGVLHVEECDTVRPI